MKIDKQVMRGVNRNNVLRCVWQDGPINQSAIAEKVRLSIPAVMKIVDELEAEEIVLRAGKGKPTSGKRPDLIALNSEAHYTVGVDVGRTTLRAVLCNLQGDICFSSTQPTGEPNPVDLLVNRICKMIHNILDQSNIPQKKLLGVGIAMPGLIDEAEGIVIHSPDFSWENVPLFEMLKERLNYPVKIENANLSLARAEDRSGAGKNSNFLICVNVGHGIGAGLLLDGHPYKGCSGTAGELGHMVVEPNGPLCTCGNRGCLEAVASGEAIRRDAIHMIERGIFSKISEIVHGDLTKVDAKIVFKAAAQNDPVAEGIVSHAAEYLGTALANCINLLDPDRIVLCGGLTRNGDKFIRQIQNYMNARRMRGSGRSVKLRVGLLDEYSTALGATQQYIDAFFASGSVGEDGVSFK